MVSERQGLVTITTIEEPIFTRIQKETLVRRSFKYLAENRIEITSENVDKAALVTLDALNRGLKLFSKSQVLAKEGVGKYLDSGFAERQILKDNTRKTIEENLRYQETADFVGPLCLPKKLLVAASEEIKDFLLDSQVNACQNLVDLAEQRKRQLQELKDIVLTLLPDNLQANAKSRQWTMEEESGLVRNLITSQVFRKTNFPIISIEEVTDFVQKLEVESSEYFTEADLNQAVNTFEEMGVRVDNQTKSYLLALAIQTRDVFKKNLPTEIDRRDQLFRALRNQLLLLHPALEEQQIVIDAKEYQEGVRSLWQEGFYEVFDGLKIPKKEILIEAARQANAAGSIGRVERLEKAIKSWNQFEREGKANRIKLETLGIATDELEKIVAKLRRKIPEGQEIRLKVVLDKELKEIRSGRLNLANRMRWAREVGEASVKRWQLAEMLLERVTSETGDGMAELPRDFFIMTLGYELAGLTRSLGVVELKLRDEKNKLSSFLEQFQEGQILKRQYKYLRAISSNYDVDRSLANLTLRIAQFREKPDLHIFEIANQESQNAVVDIVKKEIRRLKANKKYRKSVGFGHLNENEIDLLIALIKKDAINPLLLNIVTQVILGRIEDGLTKVKSHDDKLGNLEQKRVNLTETRNRLQDDQNSPLPEDAKRDLDWVINFRKQTSISQVPSIEFGTLLVESAAFAKLNLAVIREILPRHVDKRSIKDSLDAEVFDLEYSVERLERIVSKWADRSVNSKRFQELKDSLASRRATLTNAKRFRSLLDSDLLALDEAYGMSISQYLNLLEHKILVVARTIDLPEIEERSRQVTSRFDQIKTEIKLSKATENLDSTTKKLVALRLKPHEKGHIKRMTELGFVLAA